MAQITTVVKITTKELQDLVIAEAKRSIGGNVIGSSTVTFVSNGANGDVTAEVVFDGVKQNAVKR
jgi:hypothetical protein